MSREIVLEEGERLQISCNVIKGSPPIKFSWYHNGEKISHHLNLVVADSGFLSLLTSKEVSRQHAGYYTCKADNNAGTAFKNATVLIEGIILYGHLFFVKKPFFGHFSYVGINHWYKYQLVSITRIRVSNQNYGHLKHWSVALTSSTPHCEAPMSYSLTLVETRNRF